MHSQENALEAEADGNARVGGEIFHQEVTLPPSSARKQAIVERADAVPEIASELREGMELLARALCALAVERHANNLADHREKAAVLYIDCMSDFREVKITEQTRNWLAQLLKIDPKSMPKGPR